MTTTISYGETAFEPQQVDGWEQEYEPRSIVHYLLAGGIEVTHAPPAQRTMVLKLVFVSEADAAGCLELHKTAPYIDLYSDVRALVNGRYVVADGGTVQLELDDKTRDVWIVTVDATEVPL